MGKSSLILMEEENHAQAIINLGFIDRLEAIEKQLGIKPKLDLRGIPKN